MYAHTADVSTLQVGQCPAAGVLSLQAHPDSLVGIISYTASHTTAETTHMPCDMSILSRYSQQGPGRSCACPRLGIYT